MLNSGKNSAHHQPGFLTCQSAIAFYICKPVRPASKVLEVTAPCEYRVLLPFYPLLLVAWIATSYFSGREFDAQKRPLELSEARVFAVTVSSSVAEDFVRSAELSGLTEAQRKVEIAFERGGRVVELAVARGARVAAGDLIAVLDDAEPRAAYEQAEAGVAQAKAAFDQAERDLATAEALADQGFTAENRLAASRAQRNQAEAAYEQAQAAERSALNQLDKTRLLAPIAGTVEETFVEVGDFVGGQGRAIRLIDLAQVTIHLDAPVTLASELSPGMEARVAELNAATGTVSYISGEVNQATNTFAVEVLLDNPNNQLKDGQSVEVTLDFAPVAAHKVTLDLFMPDNETGQIGLKYLLPGETTVQFAPVSINNVYTQGAEAWVTGPAEIDLIVTGAGFVDAGETVIPRSVEEIEALLAAQAEEIGALFAAQPDGQAEQPEGLTSADSEPETGTYSDSSAEYSADAN